MIMCSIPDATHSSTTYWICGLSTTVNISFGCALVAGRKRVPSPAAGRTALRTFRLALIGCGFSAMRFLSCLFFLRGLFFFRGTFLGANVLHRRLFRGRFLSTAIFRRSVLAAGVFTFRGGLVLFASSLRGFPGVIRDVPARPFELNRRRGDHRLHFAATMRAFPQVRSFDFLDFVRVAPALQALVFVQWHSDSLRFSSKQKSIACVTKCPGGTC